MAGGRRMIDETRPSLFVRASRASLRGDGVRGLYPRPGPFWAPGLISSRDPTPRAPWLMAAAEHRLDLGLENVQDLRGGHSVGRIFHRIEVDESASAITTVASHLKVG